MSNKQELFAPEALTDEQKQFLYGLCGYADRLNNDDLVRLKNAVEQIQGVERQQQQEQWERDAFAQHFKNERQREAAARENEQIMEERVVISRLLNDGFEPDQITAMVAAWKKGGRK